MGYAEKFASKKQDKPGVSIEEAIAVLEAHSHSPRALAALKTIKSDFESGDPAKAKDGPPSPGQKAAQAGAPGQDFDNPKTTAGERLAAA